MRLAAAMDEQSDREIAGKKQRDQMLKLVAKGFYNELTNYGVRKDEIVWVILRWCNFAQSEMGE